MDGWGIRLTALYFPSFNPLHMFYCVTGKEIFIFYRVLFLSVVVVVVVVVLSPS